MRVLLLICLLFLTACKSTIPSETIANGVIKDLNTHQQTITNLEKQTSKECKTEAFMASLNAIKNQTESISGQVKSISQACQTEKRILEQSVLIRNIIIGILTSVLALLLFLLIRFKRI